MIERSQGHDALPRTDVPEARTPAMGETGPELASAQVSPVAVPSAAQGPDPRSLLVFEPTGMFGGPEAIERILKTDHFTSLAEKLEQATNRHAEAVTDAVTDALRSNADMMIGGRFQMVERPDEFDGLRYRLEGLRLSFPCSADPEVTWDLSITSTQDLRDWRVEAFDAKERIQEILEEWGGEDVRPVDVGKDVASWAADLPGLRQLVLNKRKFPGY